MRYGEGLLEEILRRTDLVQLVGKRVKLERKGRVFWGCCPFHKEKTASFKVENERRTYHCFGCGVGGDAFKWLKETEGLSFPEAVKRLAEDAGVELPAWTPEDEAREQRRKSLYEIISVACKFFEDQLRGRAGENARRYLKSRGLEENAWARWYLGFAPDSNAALKDHLAKQNVALEDMVEAGLVRPADNESGGGRAPRDFFYDRVIFPIADVRGRIVAFGGRGLDEEAKPKYINTGETTLFSKGRLLFNFKNARDVALKGAPLIVAEGYMDVIALAEAGFAGSVAPLGTALTEDQLALLWKTAPEPILCFDGDEAGTRAAARAARLALPQLAPGQSLRFAFLPSGDDPDSFLRAQGAEPMRRLLDAAKPLTDVLWLNETEGKDFSTPERRAGLEAQLAEIVRAIRDGKIADYYKRDFDDRVFKAFKQRTRAPFTPGRGTQPRYEPRGRRQPGGGFRAPLPEPVSGAVRRSLHAVNARGAARHMKERELIGILLMAPGLIERQAETLAALVLEDPQLDRLKKELLNLAVSGARLEKAAVESHLIRQGMGVLVERLTAIRVVQTAAVADEAAADAVWLRALAQLADPDLPLEGELKTKRDEALRRYLDGGAAEDWDELQRLGEAIRGSSGQNM